MVEDHIRASHMPHMSYIMDRVESGNIKVVIEYSSDMSHINATIVTPDSGYGYVQVPLHQHLFEGLDMFRSSHQQWHPLMGSTRFSLGAMYRLTQEQTSKSLLSDKSFFFYVYIIVNS